MGVLRLEITNWRGRILGASLLSGRANLRPEVTEGVNLQPEFADLKSAKADKASKGLHWQI